MTCSKDETVLGLLRIKLVADAGAAMLALLVATTLSVCELRGMMA
jgi:hypothetical protein